MSKLSSVLPGEAPASPIMTAGSNCDCEFMRDGDADLGGSTEYLWASFGLSRVLCPLFFVCFSRSCHWVLSDGSPSCWGWLSGAFEFALPQQRLNVKDGKVKPQRKKARIKQQLDRGDMVTCLKRDPYLDEPGGRHGAGGKGRMKKRKAGEQSGTDL